jgi:hypothetical protein
MKLDAMRKQEFVAPCLGGRTQSGGLCAPINRGEFINSDLLPALNVLFPEGHTWIPASDWF